MVKRKNIRKKKEKRKSVKRIAGKVKQKSSSFSKGEKRKFFASKNKEQSGAATVQVKSSEPENKLVLEYIIHASPGLLYEFLTTPSGLAEWFADDVNVSGDVFTFIWDGAKQFAEVVSRREGKSIRFHWTDRPANTYFEFKIEKNELTEETSLIITDFSESADEKNSLELFWQEQSSRLMKVLGSVV